MRKILKLHLLFFSLLLLGSAETGEGVYDSAAPQGTMPKIKRDCSTCHASHGSGGMLALKEPVTQLCIGCHPDRKGSAEHKVDVVPSMRVTGLPLAEGKVSCITCHDPHSNIHGKMLRLSPDKLCLACHKY
jgi:predicted CXXCH cytochrome family protein